KARSSFAMVHLLRCSSCHPARAIPHAATDCPLRRSLLLFLLLLEELFGLFQLSLSLRRQVLTGPVDGELGHAGPRADSLRADFRAGHGPCDRLGVLGEGPLRRVGRDRLHVARPAFLCLLRGHSSAPASVAGPCSSSEFGPSAVMRQNQNRSPSDPSAMNRRIALGEL